MLKKTGGKSLLEQLKRTKLEEFQSPDKIE